MNGPNILCPSCNTGVFPFSRMTNRAECATCHTSFPVNDGILGRWLADLRRQIIGVDSYRPHELEAQFKAAGLENVICCHDKRGWLIMQAVNPES